MKIVINTDVSFPMDESDDNPCETNDNNNDNKEIIETKSCEDLESLTEKWLKYGDFTLTSFDKQVIESPEEWLTDTIINVSQHLLSVQFPNVKGLQNVLLNEIHELKVIDSGQCFVQIVNDGGLHWLVLSNVWCDDKTNTCGIYDSKCMSGPSYGTDVYNALKNLMPNIDNYFVHYVVQQKDTNQCGLYAIAFAQALCAGHDPSNILFSPSGPLLRDHLKQCLQLGEITHFPTGRQTILDEFTL